MDKIFSRTEIPFPPELKKLHDWLEVNGYPISGEFELQSDDGDAMFYWLGSRSADKYLVQFGQGADGALYAVWNSEKDHYPIVYMDSEGVENMVLASNFLDFLRLLAIGYSEIMFTDFSLPPQDENDGVNPVFQQWVQTTFSVSIPKTGGEIIKNAQIKEKDFNQWLQKNITYK